MDLAARLQMLSLSWLMGGCKLMARLGRRKAMLGWLLMTGILLGLALSWSAETTRRYLYFGDTGGF